MSKQAALITAPLVGLSGALGMYQFDEAKKAREEAKKLADKQNAEQLRLEGELKASEEASKRSKARAARRGINAAALSGVGASTRSTIFTSPLGALGMPGSGQKTLLGA